MAQINFIKRQQLIRQAEGYLDLVLCLDDLWPLPEELVDTMTARALESLDRLDGFSGRKSHAAFLKGQAYRLRGEYEKAVSAFWESLDKDSENIHTHLGLAWCYKRMGEVDLAIEAANRALELDPNSAIVNYNLACYWALIGQVEPCCQYLIRAIEIDGRLRELVISESDFDAVRAHPHFLSIISAIV